MSYFNQKYATCLITLLCGCESPTYANNIDSTVVYDVNVYTHDAVFDSKNTDVTRKPIKTLIIGDSEAGRCFPRVDLVKNQLESVVVDFKVSTTIQYWSDKRFEKSLNKFNPDRVVIFLGTNNYTDNKLPNVKPILDVIQNKSLECIWVGPVAARGNKNIPINNLLRDAVQPTCVYFDSIAAEIPLEDGIHPGKKGVDKWMTMIWKSLSVN